MSDLSARAELYLEVQQFYAAHMHALDSGEADLWAADFTEDGVFTPPSGPNVRGRADLATAVKNSSEQRARAGEQHRHWHGMVDVRTTGTGEIDVRCYALIIVTRRGEESSLKRACVCHDRMVRVAGRLQIREREVTRDDLAPTRGEVVPRPASS